MPPKFDPADWMQRFFSKQLGGRPDSVWHHTSAMGLMGIIATKNVWASSAEYMNDSSEIDYARKLIIPILREFLEDGNLKTSGDLLEQFLTGRNLPNTAFVLSATELRDSLNQWMHYSRNGGYALELSTAAALDGYDAKGKRVENSMAYSGAMSAALPGWYRVIYDPSRQDAITRRALSDMQKIEGRLTREGGEMLVINVIRTLLNTLCLLFKNSAFAVEHEIRYIAAAPGPGSFPYDGVTARHHRAGPQGITPYIALGPINSDSLISIMCGPGSDEQKHLAYLSCKSLLGTIGLKIADVHISQVPYRA